MKRPFVLQEAVMFIIQLPKNVGHKSQKTSLKPRTIQSGLDFIIVFSK